MSVELRPLGVRCNIACQYCYQNPQRDAGNVASQFDIGAMKAAVEKEGGPFTLFGGEPLLVPTDALHELWSWGLEKYGRNGVQTNGSAIREEHYQMFRDYKVHVGISIDGPGELNDVRWAGNLEKTRAATAKTEVAIERLCVEGMPPSLIVTLHRGNATSDKLDRMASWFRHLDAAGITSSRLHVLEVESSVIQDRYALTTEENLEAFLYFADLEPKLSRMKFDMFKDMRSMLLGKDAHATCVWRACDPYTTSAVRGVEGFGQRSNCGRTNKEGIDFAKSDTPGYERYLALYFTNQPDGGCSGCRFFAMCKGQCPGTSLRGDWRNRTEHCDLLKGIFRHIEGSLLDDGLEPLSVRPDLRSHVERGLVAAWTKGENVLIETILKSAGRRGGNTSSGGDNSHGDSHGDQPSHHGDHTDGHGDHTDGHGDHTDSSGKAARASRTSHQDGHLPNRPAAQGGK